MRVSHCHILSMLYDYAVSIYQICLELKSFQDKYILADGSSKRIRVSPGLGRYTHLLALILKPVWPRLTSPRLALSTKLFSWVLLAYSNNLFTP